MPRTTAAKSPRNPLLTASGQRYTYLGWVRKYSAVRAGLDQEARRTQNAVSYASAAALEHAYPEHWEKYKRLHKISDRDRTPPAPQRPPARKRAARKTAPPPDLLTIAPAHRYGVSGYLLTGATRDGHQVHLFLRRKADPTRIKRHLLAGKDIYLPR